MSDPVQYPLQFIFYADGVVITISYLYTDLGTITGPAGSSEYIKSPADFNIQPGWLVTLDNLNNPTFSPPSA